MVAPFRRLGGGSDLAQPSHCQRIGFGLIGGQELEIGCIDHLRCEIFNRDVRDALSTMARAPHKIVGPRVVESALGKELGKTGQMIPKRTKNGILAV